MCIRDRQYTSPAGTNIFFTHMDANGEILINKIYSEPGFESGRDIIQRADGSFVIIGNSDPNSNGESNMYLLFIDENGNKISAKIFGNNYAGFGEAIIETEDGGLGLFGTTTDMDEVGEFYLLKTDADGNL